MQCLALCLPLGPNIAAKSAGQEYRNGQPGRQTLSVDGDGFDGDLIAGVQLAGSLGEGDLGEREQGVRRQFLAVLEEDAEDRPAGGVGLGQAASSAGEVFDLVGELGLGVGVVDEGLDGDQGLAEQVAEGFGAFGFLDEDQLVVGSEEVAGFEAGVCVEAGADELGVEVEVSGPGVLDVLVVAALSPGRVPGGEFG